LKVAGACFLKQKSSLWSPAPIETKVVINSLLIFVASKLAIIN